jgi:hypothetical protein
MLNLCGKKVCTVASRATGTIIMINARNIRTGGISKSMGIFKKPPIEILSNPPADNIKQESLTKRNDETDDLEKMWAWIPPRSSSQIDESTSGGFQLPVQKK